jgi:isoleucyl-tRNA synthetase
MYSSDAEADAATGFWQQVIEVRDVVNKELEALRIAGGIGSGLDAEVDLYCGRELYDLLSKLEDELRFALITSYAHIYLAGSPPAEGQHYTLSSNDEVWVAVAASTYAKCVRCWHHREDVGTHADHPELCGRCVENVDADGEQRKFA